MEKKLIYMDNAATTKVKPEVVEAMMPYFTELFYNPSSTYGVAGEIAQEVDKARETIADFLNCEAREVFFTGGGSESDNWAIKGIADARKDKGNHIITSKIEHHAVTHACQFLEKNGYEVTYLDVDEYGMVDPKAVESAIKSNTILITIMFANNEIGTIEPVKEIGRIAHEHGVLFHTDAVQAFGHVAIDVKEMNIDMLSASAHKINGPKGVGLMYINKSIRISNLIHGGGQERGKRAGTTNAAGIIGFGKAVEIAASTLEERREHEMRLRNHMVSRVMEEIPYTKYNGHKTERLSNNASFCFRFIEGESLLLMLDMAGICGSSGSACNSGSLDPSHVLLAIGCPHEIAHGSLRLTISEETTLEDVDYTVDKLKGIVERLRSMSPLYEDFIKKGGND
ncbi:MAG: cysteine desulfurase NifS [Pseudobutyrivibrio sp.]|nr:cysteine desulfurase NifS [Pseudobutyrivibrio sp.]